MERPGHGRSEELLKYTGPVSEKVDGNGVVNRIISYNLSLVIGSCLCMFQGHRWPRVTLTSFGTICWQR